MSDPVTWSVFQKTLQELVRNLHTYHNEVCNIDDVLTAKDFENMVVVEARKAWSMVHRPPTGTLLESSPPPPVSEILVSEPVKRKRGRPRKIPLTKT